MAYNLDVHGDIDPENKDLVRTEGSLTRDIGAVNLRLAGASYAEIAQVQGYVSAAAARIATERALADTADEEDRKHGRRIARRRIERLLRSVWAKATDPTDPDHLAYAEMARKLIDRGAKLDGLDAPTEHTINYTPSVREVEEFLTALARDHRKTLPEEVDILDAEVVE